MESGLKFGPNSYENEEIDGVMRAELADERMKNPISTSKIITVVRFLNHLTTLLFLVCFFIDEVRCQNPKNDENC